jgi:hypothetical protein
VCLNGCSETSDFLITDVNGAGVVTLVDLLASKGVRVALVLKLGEGEEVMREAVNTNSIGKVLYEMMDAKVIDRIETAG